MSDTADTPSAKPKSFTGRLGKRKTRASVKFADYAAAIIINVGGLGVVVAFAFIVVFLAWTAFALFRGPTIAVTAEPTLLATTQPVSAATRPAARFGRFMGIDEDLTTVWVIDASGTFHRHAAFTGQALYSEDLGAVTAASHKHDEVALGYADGTLRLGRISYDTTFENELPPQLQGKKAGESVVIDNRVVTRTVSDQARVVTPHLVLQDAIKAASDGDSSEVVAVDSYRSDTLDAYAAVLADGRTFMGTLGKRYNMLKRKNIITANSYEIAMPVEYKSRRPLAVLLGQNARQVLVMYEDGTTLRFNTDKPDQPYLAETVDVVSDPSARVTSAQWLTGNATIIVCDSKGGVAGWFATSYPDSVPHHERNKDWLHLVKAHELESSDVPNTQIAVSYRDRQFVTGDTRGKVWIRHMTSGTTQGEIQMPTGAAPVALAMSPKNNAVAALDEHGALSVFAMNNPHADGSFKAMFGKLWYEGYPEPAYVWQSTSATDESEPKFSLVPIIFGTMKATLYAMLIAVPIAILAAIYSSEFMHPKVRTTVKSTIELMASLPSVVLGFIGALLVAPLVENDVLGTLLLFMAIPLGVAFFAYFWQMLPSDWTRLAPTWVPFVIMIVVTLLVCVGTFAVGPHIEALLFGNFRNWLNGAGPAFPGWLLILSPLCGVVLGLLFNSYIRPNLGVYTNPDARNIVGVVELVRFLVLLLLSVTLAGGWGWALQMMGFDPRGSVLGMGQVLGPYVQRNALLVGVFMGFAVIPLIYTISEDALNSVPATLRSASLGAGATPWQTAVKVVLPVATSGIFSACMIGLGRAAGETMIVLMISGRTPIIDLNLFNGMSALSANIATELPEAPQYGTLYRILFMSAVVLFIMTFIVNTAAELVRLRFRKKYQM